MHFHNFISAYSKKNIFTDEQANSFFYNLIYHYVGFKPITLNPAPGINHKKPGFNILLVFNASDVCFRVALFIPPHNDCKRQ